MRMTLIRIVAAMLAVAVLAVPAAADSVLANVSKSVRVTTANRGSSRVVTLRATFDTVAAGAFDLRRDAVAVTVGDLPEFQIVAGAKGRRRSGGRVLYRGTKSAGSPFLRRLVVWPARGQVRVDVAGVAAQNSIATANPLAVALRLGAANFTGFFATGTVVPTGTSLPFTITDTYPETFVCSTQTFVVTDPTTWATVWSYHSQDTRPVPSIDFSKDMVVGVYLGPRANRGYSAYVTKVEDQPGVVLVTITERRPSDGCNPEPTPICLYAFATVARTGKPVQFDHRVALYTCED